MGLTESDTRAKLIDPAIHARGWTEEHIRREETAGTVEIIDGKPRKKAKGRVDYVLRLKASPDSQPIAIAIIEAKAENLAPNHGLEQAKSYAACKRMNVQFVFSSNGHQFVEYDQFTGKTTQPQPMAYFPTPKDLQIRYEQGMGFDLSDPSAKPLSTKYVGGEATRRYYQDAAIRSVFEKIAQCQKRGTEKRALLSLATGAGKTFIAVHLLKRIADSGQLKRALFVCDRDELRTQGLAAFQKETYEKNAFENGILLPDRVAAMCQDLFQYFVDNGTPEQKTIIFCARDRHADDVAATMNNLYVDWCKKQGKQPLETFAFKCTAAGGKDYLAELRGASRSHFIATTVDLLTTGVDVPCLQNIVFFKYVRSPIGFYQMIGRGTRLDPPTGKLMFRIYDYTNATDLFGRTFITRKPREDADFFSLSGHEK